MSTLDIVGARLAREADDAQVQEKPKQSLQAVSELSKRSLCAVSGKPRRQLRVARQRLQDCRSIEVFVSTLDFVGARLAREADDAQVEEKPRQSLRAVSDLSKRSLCAVSGKPRRQPRVARQRLQDCRSIEVFVSTLDFVGARLAREADDAQVQKKPRQSLRAVSDLSKRSLCAVSGKPRRQLRVARQRLQDCRSIEVFVSTLDFVGARLAREADDAQVQKKPRQSLRAVSDLSKRSLCAVSGKPRRQLRGQASLQRMNLAAESCGAGIAFQAHAGGGSRTLAELLRSRQQLSNRCRAISFSAASVVLRRSNHDRRPLA